MNNEQMIVTPSWFVHFRKELFSDERLAQSPKLVALRDRMNRGLRYCNDYSKLRAVIHAYLSRSERLFADTLAEIINAELEAQYWDGKVKQ